MGLAAIALMLGFAIMPVVIYFAGALLLGRYEGGSINRLYDAVYSGLGTGSFASWAVVLGPYGLYLLAAGLRAWWRASAHLA